MMSFKVEKLFSRINQIGIQEGDGSDLKASKNFLVWLAIFMSFGGLVWGSITSYYGLYWATLSPYGYVFLSTVNIFFFYKKKVFAQANRIQIVLSLFLPFVFQCQLGGFAASGGVFFWACLALVATLSLKSAAEGFIWFGLYILLILTSAYFDEDIKAFKPEVLADFSLAFLVTNIILISSVVFNLVLYLIKRHFAIQKQLFISTLELREVQAILEEKNLALQETQVQLVNNEKMASLGQLTAGLAHEINNPVSFLANGALALEMTINDLLGIVENPVAVSGIETMDAKRSIAFQDELTLLSAEARTLIKEMKVGASRTTEIVKGLQLFSRLDEENFRATDIHENLDATLLLLRNKLSDGIEVIKEYDPEMIDIIGSPGQLNQVFMNFMVNAIQAIPDGRKGRITIITRNLRDFVEISFRDNGVGIPKDNVNRIFEPFFTTKEHNVGTGLGLSISYGIIKKHNGKIKLDSEEGLGTRLAIQLPK